MSEKPQLPASSPSSDFITLSTLRTAFLDFFNIIFRSLDLIFLSVQKRIGLFILCCLIGMGTASLYYFLKPTYYSSEMILYHNDLTRKDYYEIINNLNSLLITGSYKDLSRELNLDSALVNKLEYMQAIGMNDLSLEKDTSSRTGQRFKVQLKFSSRVATRPYQDALLGYLNSNPYIKQIKEGRKRVLEDKLLFIENEQHQLDSLKAAYNTSLGSMRTPTTFYNNEINPADIYVQSNNLANQKEDILNWFNNQAVPVMLVDGFKVPKYSERKSFKFYLALGLGVGIILGFLACLLAAIKRTVAY